MKSFSLLFLFPFLLCLSCKNTNKTVENTEQTEQMLSDSTVYGLSNLTEEYCITLAQDTLCAEAKAEFLTLEKGMNAAATEKMQMHLKNMVSGDSMTVAEMLQDFVREIDEFKGNEPGYLPPGYAMEVKQKTRINNQILLNGEQGYYQYSGGAHGIYFTEYFNFDAQTGKLLAWQNLFSDTLRVYALAQKELMSQYDDGAKMSEYYSFPNDKFYLPENFLLHTDSIEFLYGVYEITSYAQGEQVIKLPYSALAADLKTDTTLDKFLKK